jgi:CHAT domain-containing protein
MHQASAATLAEKHTEAFDLLREASDLLEEGGLMRLAALARLRRAELYFADGQLDASLREVSHVADVFAEQEDLPHLARATLLQAYIAEAREDSVTARYLCDHALDVARGQGLLDLSYLCYDLLGRLAERDGDLDEAMACYEQAIQGIDEVQSRLVLDERTSFLTDKGGIYQRAMLLALQRGNKDQALIYVEKSRSRVLGDYLRNNIDIRLRGEEAASEPLLEDLARLREEQAWLSAVVYDSESQVNLSDTAVMRLRALKPDQARQEMQKRERHIEQLLEKLHRSSAGDLLARPQNGWTNRIVTSLWPGLDRHTVMLEYYIAQQDLYIFTLTRGGINVRVVQGVLPQLERLLSLWRANLEMAAHVASDPQRANSFAGLLPNGLGLLQKLYGLLLRPVSDLLSFCKHLIVVPYGLLHYLPFHCLYDGQQFLVERLHVSYLPAASLLDICHQRGLRSLARDLPLSQSLVMGLADGGRLPHTLQEAQAVAQQLEAPCALNQEATAALLWEQGARAPLVHIAAHGLFRLDAPNFSYIQLGDRKISSIEVFNLDLSACSLVTLSACETGRAVVGGVDEVIGLGRGFLYAGAASLLPTLWKVDDASSAELMATFYRALLSGYTKAAALAGAQRDFLSFALARGQVELTHPYFWAAFHLIGDAGPLRKTSDDEISST